MSRWTVCAGWCLGWLVLIGTATAQQPRSDSNEALHQRALQSVRDLNSPKFATRKQAAHDLRTLGLHAIDALRSAENSEDLETKRIVKELLEDIKFGIVPNTPARQRAIIRAFRDANESQLPATLRKLCSLDDLALIQQVLTVRPAPEVLAAEFLSNEDLRAKLVNQNGLAWFFQQSKDASLPDQIKIVEHLVHDQELRTAVANQKAIVEVIQFVPRDVLTRIETLALSPEFKTAISEKDTALKLLAYCQECPDRVLAARVFYVLVTNQTAALEICSAGKIETMLDVLEKKLDPPDQTKLLRSLCSNQPVFQQLLATDRALSLLGFEREDWSLEQRLELAKEILHVRSIRQNFLSEGRMDRIVSLINTAPDSPERNELIGYMLNEQELLEFLLESKEFLSIVDLLLDHKHVRSDFLQLSLLTTDAVNLLVETERSDAVVKAIAEDKDNTSQMFAFKSLMASPMMVHLAANDCVGDVFAIINRSSVPTHARTLFQYACRGRVIADSVLQMRVSAGLLDLVESQSDEAERLRWLDYLIRDDVKLASLIDSKMGRRLFDCCASFDTATMRKQATSSVVSAIRSQVVPSWSENTERRDLIGNLLGDLATRSDDVHLRSMYLSLLQHISWGTQEQMESLDYSRLIRDIGKDAQGSSLLAVLVSDHRMVDAMQSSGAWDQMLDLCDASDFRSALYHRLLGSCSGTRLAADDRALDGVLKQLHTATQQELVSLVRTIVRNDALRDAAIAKGYFRTCFDALDKVRSSSSYDRLAMMQLLACNAGVAELKKWDRLGLPVELIRQETDSGTFLRTLRLASDCPAIMQWMVLNVKMDELKGWVASSSSASRESIQNRIFLDKNAIAHWARAGRLDDLLDHIDTLAANSRRDFTANFCSQKSELNINATVLTRIKSLLNDFDAAQRKQVSSSATSNPNILWNAFRNGQLQDVLDIASWADDSGEARDNVLFSNSGIVAYLIWHDRLDEAESILESFRSGDEGWRRWVLFLQQRGTLEKQIQSYLTEAPDSPLLPLMMRAAGQHAQEAEYCTGKYSIEALKHIYTDGHLWQPAAKLHAQQIDEMRQQSNFTDRLKAIFIGQLAVYYHNAVDRAGCAQALDELRVLLTQTTDSQVRNRIAMDLLLCGHVEEALTITADGDPLFHFDLLVACGRYHQALLSGQWNECTPQQWLDQAGLKRSGVSDQQPKSSADSQPARPHTRADRQPAQTDDLASGKAKSETNAKSIKLSDGNSLRLIIPASGSADRQAGEKPGVSKPAEPDKQLSQRFLLGMRIAQLLVWLGDTQQATELYHGLNQRFPQPPTGNPALLNTLARSMVEQGMIDDALRILYERRGSDRDLRYAFEKCVHKRRPLQHELRVSFNYWTNFMKDFDHVVYDYTGGIRKRKTEQWSQQRVLETMRMVYDLQTGQPVIHQAGIGVQAAEFAMSQLTRATWLGSSAQTSLCADILLGTKCYEELLQMSAEQTDIPAEHKTLFAAIAHWQLGHYAQSAPLFHELWLVDRNDLHYLYLSGEAMIRSGQAVPGAERREKASMMAVSSTKRSDLAGSLAEFGVHRQAARQYETLLKVIPVHSQLYQRYQGNLLKLECDCPELKRYYLDRALLGTTDVFDDKSPVSYVQHAAGCAEYLAWQAIKEHDFESAWRHIDEALTITPSSAALAMRIAQAFETQQQPEWAKSVRLRVAANVDALLTQYPDAPSLKQAQTRLSVSPPRPPDTPDRPLHKPTD